MRKIFLVLLFVFNLFSYSYAQHRFGFGIYAGQFSSYSFDNIYYVEDASYISIRPFYPIKAGIETEFSLGKNYFLSSGLDYTYRYIDISLFPFNIQNIFTGTRLHVFSVPFNMGKNLIFFNPNTTFGVQGGLSLAYYLAENQEFGKWQTQVVGGIPIYDGFFYTLLLTRGIVPSFNLKLNLSINMGKAGFLQPQLFFQTAVRQNIGHELYYYKRIDPLLIENQETYYERDAVLGVVLKWKIPQKKSFDIK